MKTPRPLAFTRAWGSAFRPGVSTGSRFGAWSAPRDLGPVSDNVSPAGISSDARGGFQLATRQPY